MMGMNALNSLGKCSNCLVTLMIDENLRAWERGSPPQIQSEAEEDGNEAGVWDCRLVCILGHFEGVCSDVFV